MALEKHISFVDCPGHEALMATMLSGSALMDAAILVVAANEGPQEQTREHLCVLETMNIPCVVFLNKAELVSKEAVDKARDAVLDLVLSGLTAHRA